MSAYQYYECLALDRRPGETEMREVRAVSSRAEITPTRFVDEDNSREAVNAFVRRNRCSIASAPIDSRA